ncbi:MAG TPA: MFS transporter [Candidatus Binatia bacterium]|nr:MFS transporter [Candidatus Binatia bacterium]
MDGSQGEPQGVAATAGAAASVAPGEAHVAPVAAATAARADAATWAPLRDPLFRDLWIASVASNVGTWVQSVAAVWLMTSLSPSPAMTALVQTAASLPLVIFALPAGALADMMDRRRLLLASQWWMLLASGALGFATLHGWVDPWVLLGLTFALGVGSAFTAPAWQAITLELVPTSQLPAAVALGSASINGARAIGPGLGGVLVAAVGPAFAFLANAASFVGVIAVLFRWQRRVVASELPREQVFGAIRAGLRYVRHSPALHRIYVRVGLFVVASSALLALLPVLARRDMHQDAAGYGLLLASLGVGAVGGAAALPRLRAALGTDRLVDASGIGLAIVLAALSFVPPFWAATLALFFAGVAWTVPLSSLNVATQTVVPGWVRARALAFHLLVLQGGLALGAAAWGWIADRTGTPEALAFAAATLVVATAVGLRVRLKHTDHLDLSPAARALPKEVAEAAGYEDGPVLVTIEYRIDPARGDEFAQAMEVVRRMRRRGGAWRWGLFADTAEPGAYVESFLVESWLDHLRQHERMTVLDRDISARARAFHVGDGDPIVRHLIARLPIG